MCYESSHETHCTWHELICLCLTAGTLQIRYRSHTYPLTFRYTLALFLINMYCEDHPDTYGHAKMRFFNRWGSIVLRVILPPHPSSGYTAWVDTIYIDVNIPTNFVQLEARFRPLKTKYSNDQKWRPTFFPFIPNKLLKIY